MPWVPELFSAGALQGVLDKYGRQHLRSVPFFDGLLTEEMDALLDSFAGVPEVQHPVLGRIRGERAFRRFVADTNEWLTERHGTIEHVNFLVTDARGVEELVLHLDGDDGRIALPFAGVCDHDADERIVELRLYFSPWALTGRHAGRPPLLQADPDLRDTDELRALRERIAPDGGAIGLEPCTVTEDGGACALEYNVVARGGTAVSPTAGLAVHDRGPLDAVRTYGDEA